MKTSTKILIASAAFFGLLVLLIYLKRRKTQTQYFSLADINSRGTPPPPHLQENAKNLVDNLNKLQAFFYNIDPSYTIQITSTYRSPEHNAEVGGVTNSYHLQARAVDFTVKGLTGEQAAAMTRRAVDAGAVPVGGVGEMTNAVHYDDRGEKKAWKYTNGSGAGTYSVQWKNAHTPQVFLFENTSMSDIDI